MRCGIYTRKSSEEGLAQEFNSLDAQRESAEAYIVSQRHAGWTAVAEHYDDGGYTGANLDRPALERLLADIEAGSIDCVIVYKVDRLSRSLLDFARLMGIFEKHGVSLVSVTQQFNTTASLGRLTLNILLSFAQFEREMIAERTRDKMSAARRKGKWVGGRPVLGYDVAADGGKLVVNEGEAQQVRAIFALYLEYKSLLSVLSHLQQRHWTTKRWTTKNARVHSGRPYRSPDVLRLLTNVIYTGKIRHQGQIYAGEHAAIVDDGVWQRVQRLLQQNGRSDPRHVRQLSRPSSAEPQRSASPECDRQTSAPVEISSRFASRITRLLALAVKFDGLRRDGIVKNYAEMARLGRVSRARVTQIMSLLNLAPDIQQDILLSPKMSVPESSIRALSAEVIWSRQREQWSKYFANDDATTRSQISLTRPE
jgi:DNA invertase Pin-like site-specific DNA recombinase